MNNKYGQVWIETVLYTVVILAIIAIVLSFTIPKLNEGKDRLVIEQSINALKDMDRSIYDVAKQSGNVRIIEFSMKRGTLYISPNNKKITLNIDGLQSVYSEPGQKINDGRVEIEFFEGQKLNSINLTLNYPDTLITFDGKGDNAIISSASLPYTFSLENTGNAINIKEVYER